MQSEFFENSEFWESSEFWEFSENSENFYKTMAKIIIKSSEVLCDLRSAGWLESEINPDSNLHRRHEAADICEKDNVDRVWRILGVCAAEVRMALKSVMTFDFKKDAILNDLATPEQWKFSFRPDIDTATLELFKEKIHEYMVARVMEDRMRVILPGTALTWSERAQTSMSEIASLGSLTAEKHPVRRRLCPI